MLQLFRYFLVFASLLSVKVYGNKQDYQTMSYNYSAILLIIWPLPYENQRIVANSCNKSNGSRSYKNPNRLRVCIESNVSDILCTRVSNWMDAMADCLHEGGRPLTHAEIKMTNLSKTIDVTVWTAEYATVSYDRGSENIGPDVIGNMICGSVTVLLENLGNSNVTEIDVLAVNYRNCTKKQAYICAGSTYLEVYLTGVTWLDAKSLCNIKHQNSSKSFRIEPGKAVTYVYPKPQGRKKLDIWISLIAKQEIGTIRNKIPTEEIVQYGSWVFSDGLKMVENSHCSEFTALCRLEGLEFVNESLLTDCRNMGRANGIRKDGIKPNKDTAWLSITIIVSSAVLFGNISGCVLLWIYQKRKFHRFSTIENMNYRTADTVATTTSGSQTVFNRGRDKDYGHQDNELQQTTSDAVPGARCVMIKMH